MAACQRSYHLPFALNYLEAAVLALFSFENEAPGAAWEKPEGKHSYSKRCTVLVIQLKTNEGMTGDRSYTRNLKFCEIKAWKKKKSVLNGLRIHDFCDTGAVLYQLSYETNWELVTLCVRNIPIDG